MRKKLLVSAVIFLSALQLSAQLQKQEIYVGVRGEKRFGQISSNGFRPSISIGLGDHSAIGVYYDYTKFKDWNGDITKTSTHISAVGLFYDYYHYIGKSERWGWFASADLSVGRTRVTGFNAAAPINDRYEQIQFSLAPGIFYKASKNVMLHLDIGSVFLYDNKYGPISLKSNFARTINLGIRIGLGNGGKKKTTVKAIF